MLPSLLAMASRRAKQLLARARLHFWQPELRGPDNGDAKNAADNQFMLPDPGVKKCTSQQACWSTA